MISEEKLKAIFADSNLKTLGDLADASIPVLPGIEKMPEGVRSYSLDPYQSHMLPENYFFNMMRAGISMEMAGEFNDIVADLKFGWVAQAQIPKDASECGMEEAFNQGFIAGPSPNEDTMRPAPRP